ncbi:MAG: hypothetical protein QM537_09995 [Candidatus Symbiobacter sp.]|nr:hypothetical protein [Candidatus Symbiobacter sp.]
MRKFRMIKELPLTKRQIRNFCVKHHLVKLASIDPNQLIMLREGCVSAFLIDFEKDYPASLSDVVQVEIALEKMLKMHDQIDIRSPGELYTPEITKNVLATAKYFYE